MRVMVGDTRLYFDVDGASLVPDGPRMHQRPTIVLIHGGPGGDHSEYKPYLSPLADCAQVVYLDQRGQGRSDPSEPRSWNLQRWAADVRDFCDTLEIERPVVVGESFGSFVALRYAIEYPDHPSKLVLMATGARHDLERFCDAMGRFGGEEQRAAARRFFTEPTEAHHLAYRKACWPLYSVVPQDADVAARVIDRADVGRHFFGDEGMRFDHRDGAAGVRCPVLVINGERDPITPLEGAAELAQALPAHLVEFVTIENAAHDLSLDAPAEVVQRLRQFICS